MRGRSGVMAVNGAEWRDDSAPCGVYAADERFHCASASSILNATSSRISVRRCEAFFICSGVGVSIFAAFSAWSTLSHRRASRAITASSGVIRICEAVMAWLLLGVSRRCRECHSGRLLQTIEVGFLQSGEARGRSLGWSLRYLPRQSIVTSLHVSWRVSLCGLRGSEKTAPVGTAGCRRVG